MLPISPAFPFQHAANSADSEADQLLLMRLPLLGLARLTAGPHGLTSFATVQESGISDAALLPVHVIHKSQVRHVHHQQLRTQCSNLQDGDDAVHTVLQQGRRFLHACLACAQHAHAGADLPTGGDLPLDPQGTAFQHKVWALVATIPCGRTRTYGQIARELGNAGLARAVGQACAANPLPLFIPCHRVVGACGPGNYSLSGPNLAGHTLKRLLLAMERGLPHPAARS